MDHGARHHRATSRRGSFLAVGRVLAGALSLLLLVGFGYGWYEYRSLDAGMQKFHLHNLGRPAAGASASSAAPVGKEQNILLVGLDSRDGLSAQERRLLKVGNDSSLATDTVMVLHVPADGRRATMISIPRDAFVAIPGYLKNKVNAAYADAYTDAANKGASHKQAEAAGADLLIETVSQLTGLRIDHFVQVGFGGFYTIAKALKSVPVNLCAATDDTVAHNRATGQSGGSGFKMSAGHHDLTPLQSLEFVRQRHNIAGGDLAREKRQRYFIAAAFNKIASAGTLLNPGRLNALIKAVTGAFYVDDGFDLVGFAQQLVDLTANRITGYTIPTQGTRSESIAGVNEDVIVVDPAAVRRFVAARLNPSSAPSAPPRSSRPSGATTPRPGTSTSGTTAPAPETKGCVF